MDTVEGESWRRWLFKVLPLHATPLAQALLGHPPARSLHGVLGEPGVRREPAASAARCLLA
eukprot:8668508-Alexandrium_andersonii.AAC.1